MWYVPRTITVHRRTPPSARAPTCTGARERSAGSAERRSRTANWKVETCSGVRSVSRDRLLGSDVRHNGCRAEGTRDRTEPAVSDYGLEMCDSVSALLGALRHDQQFVALRIGGYPVDPVVEPATVRGIVELCTESCERHRNCCFLRIGRLVRWCSRLFDRRDGRFTDCPIQCSR